MVCKRRACEASFALPARLAAALVEAWPAWHRALESLKTFAERGRPA